MHKVSALFVRSDSCYFDLVFDAWDASRDARNYAGPWPVVAHPPCRGWGRLRHFAKPRSDELELAFFAVDAVRRWGGVLEHPHASRLWDAAELPQAGEVDQYGGFTILVDQGWWAHPAPKPTWLYIVGMRPHHVGLLPVSPFRAQARTMKLSPEDRERTPPLFGQWLVDLAGRCYVEPGRVVTPCDRSRLPGAAAACYADLAAPGNAEPAGLVTPDQARRYVDLVERRYTELKDGDVRAA